MAHAVFSKDVPSDLPGASVGREDMARVTVDDWAGIRRLARGYCRTVDATRSRKRVDGSATVVRGGHAPYGTDDTSDDVAQDAVLLFAQNLAKITRTCAVASVSVATREADAWQYVRRDGTTMVVTRVTLQRWAVRDAAARNGYRLDVPPAGIDATPGAQVMRGPAHAEHLATATHLAQNSEIVFRMAWGDGRDFPTLRELLPRASVADDLGRTGVLALAAQSLHGGKYGSRRNVIRTRDAALAEWRTLSERLDDARDTLTYHAARECATA